MSDHTYSIPLIPIAVPTGITLSLVYKFHSSDYAASLIASSVEIRVASRRFLSQWRGT